jgi:hypothetical protein
MTKAAIDGKTMKTVVVAILLTAVSALSQADPHPRSTEYAAPLIREEQDIIVGGVHEMWRLQWRAVPTPYCEPSFDSLTCPCMGFAYGEAGDLFLIRLRGGSEIDRLHLTPLFTEEPNAIVQRWPTDDKRDFDLSQKEGFSKIVSHRPVVQVMHFADYDHDGEQTEFYLQTETLPCGKSTGVVIGVSRSNPRLHVFSSASNPTKPLYLQGRQWEALRNASSGPIRVIDWRCGDHGADTQTEVQLDWSAGRIDGTRREYTCPAGNEPRHFVRKMPL